MSMWSPDRFLKAWNFAADAHEEQRVPGSKRPYLTHVGGVAMEVLAALATREDVALPDLAVQCALLHDVVEDTSVTVDAIATVFGSEVASGVAALTKDKSAGDKTAQMADSLRRIQQQPHEVWMVKLADRITNLQPPPGHWNQDKIRRYLGGAETIYECLHEACPVLSARMLVKLEEYREYT